MNGQNNVVVKMIKKYMKNNLGALAGLFLMCAAVGIMTPKFFTVSNILNLLKANSVNAILSCALTMAILLGQIDISVGSTVGLSGMVSAILITNYGFPIIPTILICLLIGMLVGIFNGFCIAYVDVPAFIATLVTQCIGRGLAQVICNGNPVRVRNETFSVIGTYTFSNGVSIITLYAAVCLILITIFLYKTKTGSYLYAIGGNVIAAKYSGINVRRVMMIPYIIGGILAAFCGIIWVSRLGSATPTLGESFELDAVAATALGGASMSGGVANIGGTLLGVFMIGVIQNGLNLLGVNSFWQYVAKGVIIIIAVVIDILRKKYRNN